MIYEEFSSMDNTAKTLEDAMHLLLSSKDEGEVQNAEEYLVQCANKGNDTVRQFFADNCLLEGLCRRGIEWAFEWADNGNEIDFIDYLHYVGFLLECYKNGIWQAKEIIERDYSIDYNYEEKEFVEVLLKSEKDGNNYAHELICQNIAFIPNYDWLTDYFCSDYAWAITENLDKAFQHKKNLKWLESSVKRKNIFAQFILGVLYMGECPNIKPKKESLAAKYLEAAALGGLQDLTNRYRAKLSAEKKSAELNRKKEETETLRMKLEAESIAKKEKEKIENQIEKADAGLLSAEDYLKLGLTLAHSNQIKKNSLKGTKYLKKAAEMGNATAQYYFGKRLIEGQGCRKNWNAGMRWLKKAASLHHPKAMEYVKANDIFLNRIVHRLFK